VVKYQYHLSYDFTVYKVKHTEVLRPIIPVELQYKDNDPIEFTMLIDSGADFSLISQDVAASLGISTKRDPDDTIQGVTGDTSTLTEQIMIRFGMGHKYEFKKEIPIQITKIRGYPFIPALGRDPLFKEFDIHFRMGLPTKERKFVLSKLL
jgi:hypothetical protein